MSEGSERIEQESELPKKRKGCSSGCLIASVISIALIGACLIIGGIIFVVMAVSNPESGALSGNFQPFAKANDGLLEKFSEGNSSSSNKIALIEIRGMIMDADGGGFFQAASSSLLVRQLDRAQKDPDVKAVILYLDTPGGEVTASDNIYKKILEVKDAGKIVVSYMNTVAASGGYYIAVASDLIVAHRLCITGSIGVIMQTYNYQELLGKIGVHAETYKSGKMKDMLDGSRIRTEEEKALAQKIVNQIYSEFVSIVAEGRKNLSEELIKSSEIGDGRIFLGSEALKLGLVDENGFYDDAIHRTLEIAKIPFNDYKIVTYKRVVSFSEIFAQMHSSENKISVELGNKKSWENLVESGRPYFLPTR
jgi:protease-4